MDVLNIQNNLNLRYSTMKKIIFSLLFLSFYSSISSADFLGVYAGIGNWKPDFDGFFNNEGDDLTLSDLGIDDDSQSQFYIALEHPIPFLPNVRLNNTDLKSSGTGQVTATFSGTSFTGDVSTDFDLSHRDYVIYYELLDNWVNLDFGLTARQFDGFVSLSDATQTEREDFDGTLPLLYIKGRFDLSLTGLSLSAEMHYIGVDGNTISDIAFNVGYELSFGLGLEAGVRTFSLEVDDEDDFTTDIEFSGSYINLTYHF